MTVERLSIEMPLTELFGWAEFYRAEGQQA